MHARVNKRVIRFPPTDPVKITIRAHCSLHPATARTTPPRTGLAREVSKKFYFRARFAKRDIAQKCAKKNGLNFFVDGYMGLSLENYFLRKRFLFKHRTCEMLKVLQI